jgi:hypothetical protein
LQWGQQRLERLQRKVQEVEARDQQLREQEARGEKLYALNVLTMILHIFSISAEGLSSEGQKIGQYHAKQHIL